MIEGATAAAPGHVEHSAVAQQLAREGALPVPTTPQAFAQLIAGEIPRWAQVIQRGNVKLD